MSRIKLTILITVPYFYPKTGGLENYALETARGLFNAGWRVVVACGDSVTEVQCEDLQGITVYRLPIRMSISNTPVNPAWFRQLRRIIRKEKPDVINAHTPVPFMVDMTALAAGRTPLIITNHAATLAKPGSLTMTTIIALYQALQRLTFLRAQAIIAVSPYVRDTLPRYLRRKTRVISNAVHSVAPARREAGEGLITIPTSLETAHAWKGLDSLLDAMAIAKKVYGSVANLTVLGEGSLRGYYKQRVATLGLTQSVRFVGLKAPADRDSLLRKARALVAYPTSPNDAFPTVFLEAWRQGTPIIAAAIGPIPSLITNLETGLLVVPNNPPALADALQAIQANTELAKQMGERGRRLVSDRYLWPAQITQLTALLEELI